MHPTADKKADLAGPGIGDYAELEQILPRDYQSLLNPKETQRAIFAAKNYIEEHLCKELNLMMVTVPLIVDVDSGVNDYLDRDGSRTPIQFHISNDRDLHPVDAQVVQAATKWKRVALQRFGMQPGEGLCTDMRAVRKDYFLDHDHSAYVDQWDWERAITAERPQLSISSSRPSAPSGACSWAPRRTYRNFSRNSSLRAIPIFPKSLPSCMPRRFWTSIPTCPASSRETAILQQYPAVFIIGIGWTLADGYPHEMRAADYDDWVTETKSSEGRTMHGINGDILVWNHVTRRRHELSSMGIRVNAETLRQQLELTGQMDFLKYPYHQAIVDRQIPLSIGGGIGQSRTLMLLLRKAHLGEVSATVWPKILKEMCARKNIFVIE